MAEQKYTISDIIETYISGDWGNDEPTEEASCPVSCIRGADIVPIYNSEFNNIPLRYISEKSLASRALQEGDIVIEKSGGSPTQSTGRVVYISKELLEEKQDVVCSNFCAAFRIKPEWDAKYVYYYLQHIYNAGVFFNFEGKTSGLKNLIMDTAFKSITIKKIAIETQRSIATVLSTIESKMAANRAINHYLEAMTKQLYDYWFVQFDFPDANGNPYKSAGGKMEWNEKLKREIPEGWTAKSINEITECVRGVSYDKSDLLTDGTGVLVLRGNNIQDNKLVYDNNVAFVPATLISQDQFIKKGDIIMTMSSGSKEHIGKCAYFHKDCVHTYGAFLNKYRAKENFSMLLFSFMSSPFFKGTIKNICNGTGINNLTNQNFDSVYMPCPGTNVLKQYNAHIEPLFGKIGCLDDEIEILTIKRDMLLPLLMNGQVSVTQLNNDLSQC